MGLTSQLGPIDPQVAGLPALGMENALDTLANLACRFPGASDMIAQYLNAKLSLGVLGYYNRIGESAVQYAERLLAGKALASGQTLPAVANQLVKHYKDHGFVIDTDEARSLLGADVIREDTVEYMVGDEIYRFLDLFSFILELFRQKKIDYVGSVSDGMSLRDSPNSDGD